MKRICFGLVVSVGISALTASADEPARLTTEIAPSSASLGLPRPAARLGLPRAATTIVPSGETLPVGFPTPTPVSDSLEPLMPLLATQSDPKIEKKPPVPDIKEGEAKEKELPKPTVAPLVSPVVPGPALLMPSANDPVVSHPVVSMPTASSDSPGCTLPRAVTPFVNQGGRGYASVEYLNWWMKSYSLPVLATTGPVGSGGVIGQPGVVPVLGGGYSDPTGRGGARGNLGYWFGANPNVGLDANFFFLGTRGNDGVVNSNAYPLLARPFLVPNSLSNPNDPRLRLNIPGQFSEITALPGLQNGAVSYHTDSQFWGGDLAARLKWCDNGVSRLDALVGYRHLDLRENLEVNELFMGTPGGANAGVIGAVFDKFRTSNSFNGGMVGLLYQREVGRWNFGLNSRLALGATNQTLDIVGGQTQVGPGAVTPTVPGGLLALNSNIGHYSKNRIAFVPEVGLTLGYDITPRLQATVGYSLIYWSRVLRPGDQVDQVLDLTRVPILNDPRVFPQAANVAPVRQLHPAPLMKESDLWVQGVSLGLKYAW